jgi:hypothetical protein
MIDGGLNFLLKLGHYLKTKSARSRRAFSRLWVGSLLFLYWDLDEIIGLLEPDGI